MRRPISHPATPVSRSSLKPRISDETFFLLWTAATMLATAIVLGLLAVFSA